VQVFVLLILAYLKTIFLSDQVRLFEK